ncbi:Fpg/Nei family DNA glycosylase [Naumannella halotolerans]|uniref:Fpg/Nei family DNA glycosylase n=1 Tax=Naumannella halotolerans TaxID=993414 RepID=UPI00370DB3F5
MPEGDTTYRAAKQLREALQGATLTRAELRVPRYASTDLRGFTVTASRVIGKNLLLDLRRGDRELTLHSHLKMEGAWHVYSPGQRWRRPGFTARVVLGTSEHQAVGFDLGLVRLGTPEQTAASLADLGPDPLAADFDADEAVRRLAADPERSIGEALLDQTVIAGLGNVYRCELCFLTGVHPAAPVGEVDLPPLVELAHTMINRNADQWGRNFSPSGGPREFLWVHMRERRPCRRCGTAIRQARFGGETGMERFIWWCPRCQPR